MSTTDKRRRLKRLEDLIGRPTAPGIYRMPASEVLSTEEGYESRFIRRLRYKYMFEFVEKFRKYVLGDDYVPTWEASRTDLKQWHEDLRSLDLQFRKNDPHRERRKARRIDRLVRKRRKIEMNSGRPVAFLLPFDPIVLDDGLLSKKPNPAFDLWIGVGELIPVYADGTEGDPKLYSIYDPF